MFKVLCETIDANKEPLFLQVYNKSVKSQCTKRKKKEYRNE